MRTDEWIVIKFNVGDFYKKKNCQTSSVNETKIMHTLCEDLCGLFKKYRTLIFPA